MPLVFEAADTINESVSCRLSQGLEPAEAEGFQSMARGRIVISVHWARSLVQRSVIPMTGRSILPHALLGLGAIAALLASTALSARWPDWRWHHESLHAPMETLGDWPLWPW